MAIFKKKQKEQQELGEVQHVKKKREIYDPEYMEYHSLTCVEMEHPEWPSDKKIEYSLSEEGMRHAWFIRMVLDIQVRYHNDVGKYKDWDYCYRRAYDIMKEVPEELIPNINEWIEYKPLSDIKINGVSVNDIINQFGKKQPIYFLEALDCMIYWKQTNYSDPMFCKLFSMRR